MYLSEKEFDQLLKRCPALAAQKAISISQPKTKYRNVKVYVYSDGMISQGEKDAARGKPEMVFDSIKEFDRWNELLLLQRAGKIQNLQRQVKLVIQEKTDIGNICIREVAYRADFVYNNETGKTVVEDVKPFDVLSGKYKTTKDFDLKWKLLKVKYQQYVFEIF